MSFRAMAWAAEQSPPTATAKLALMMMASMADGESMECYPSHQYLADACMVSKSTIIRSVKDLETSGFLSIKRRSTSKGKSSNVYKLTMCQPDTTPPEANDDTMCHHDTTMCQSDTPHLKRNNGAMCQSDTSVNLTLPMCQSDTTPSVNLTHRNSHSFKQSMKQSMREPDKSVTPACPHAKIIDLYHKCLPMLPRVLETVWQHGDGANDLRQRWKENTEHQDLEFWRGFFGAVATNPWWVDPEQWGKANLKWLIKKKRFYAVIEYWANQAEAA